MTKEIPDDIREAVFRLQYRMQFHLSEAQYEAESDDAKWEARTIWALLDERANLEEGKRQQGFNN